ncbi:NYN domain-containing protein [Spirochaeta lutea]|uniref:NYN domain-containing protein n=1 Tax=Spirochaeta lutea TaxID=1480694 RepID=UPI001EE6BD39|nr:NYN domain-containing protein [Spirochaeta lutea]
MFVIKMACGNSSAIKPVVDKLAEYNFDIRDTPKITKNYKNRADLIISLEALETIILEKPIINRYIFITSDSDFTVIMEKLRKYGKEVCLITKEEYANKPVLNNSCDEIYILESFMLNSDGNIEKGAKTKRGKKEAAVQLSSNNEEIVEEIIKKILATLDTEKLHLTSFIGSKFHQMDKSMVIKRSKYKNLNGLLTKLESDGKIKKEKNEKGHPCIVLTTAST